MEVRGAVAVVTGAASGIGRATALELARRGADVVLADIHEERLGTAGKEVTDLGRHALTVRCDVRSDADMEQLEREVMEEFGRVDIVMNNAGVALLGPPETLTMDDWNWILQVNLYGVIRGVRAFVPHLLRQGRGHLVNTASVAGLYAYNWDAIPYVTSKFAVVGLTEALALYLRPHGVGVSVLCPGLVETNLGETARVSGIADPRDWLLGMPLDDPVTPEAVAGIVCDGIRDERFLLVTHPTQIAPVMRDRGADYEAFVAAMIEHLATPPNLHRR